jgi:hypothetical protein
MSNKAVFSIVDTSAQAEQIVNHLRLNGFSNDDISVLFPDKDTTREFAHEKHTKAPEGIATGATAGGILGGAAGWLTGVGALLIPGAGPFLAAGPIVAALSGVTVGAAVGGIAGGLIGLGIPELEAKRYEGRIKAGNILISVHTEDSEEISKVETIYKEYGAQDICSSSESSVQEENKSRRGEPVETL